MCEKLFIWITLLISWFLSIVFIPQGAVGATVIIMMIPAIVAIILQMVRTKSIKVILRPFIQKINIKAVIFTFIFPLMIVLLCSVLALITGIGKFNSNSHDSIVKVLTFIVYSIPFSIVTLGEEYGWRGYLLPCFENKYGLKKANIKVGIVWCIYHLPAIFLINLDGGILNAMLFTAIQLAFIFFFNYAFTYLYCLSQNVVLAAIMHSIWNNINTLVLGDAYRNTSNGLILGNVNIINGEKLFGMIFLAIFSVIIVKKLFKSKESELIIK